MAYNQAPRLMQFTSPAGADVLLIESLQGVEGISRLFDFQVELLATNGTTIDPTQLVGNRATVAIGLLDVQGSRYINGVVASFEATAGDDNFDVYRAQIVPSLWQLTLATNCRVFQNKNVMDVIKAVIGPYGLSLSDVTTFSYQPMDYCTQYNETDFNFISRLMEQFGIFYWFEHSESDNKVMFGDDISAYKPCPDVSEIQYSPQTTDTETMYHSIIGDIRVTSSMLTGKHSAMDYDFRTYSNRMSGPNVSTSKFGSNALERYAWPTQEAGFVRLTDKTVATPNHGGRSVPAQADASDSHGSVFTGTSTARTFTPGFTFSMTEHPFDAWNEDFLLLEVAHHVVQVPPYMGDPHGTRTPYTNGFTAIPATTVYRPSARTSKPMAHGPQTAKVVGNSGDEIYLDKYGRICVEFFWNREGTGSADNTWVRVAQHWSGPSRGTYFWPRVGDEVIIDFINGDPDDPIAIGSVYNAVNMPKYALPDMGTRSGIVTRSSKGGGVANANELRFEDKTGSEQIFINAEKDIDINIENDSRWHTTGQDSLMVDKDQLEKIGGNYNRQIAGDQVESVAGKQDLAVTGAMSHKISGAYGADIGGDSLAKIGGKQGVHVSGEVSHKYDDKMSLQVAMDLGEKVGQNWALQAGMNAYVKGGMAVTIEAGMELTLKAAGGFITIGPSGVAISGTLVMINSGGAAGSGTPPETSDPSDPSAPSQPKDPDKADDGTKGGKM